MARWAPRCNLRTTIVVLLVDVFASASYMIWTNVVIKSLRQQGVAPVAVVFFGDFSSDSQIGPETQERLRLAEALDRDGRVEHLLCVGGWRGESRPVGSQLMTESLIATGVPAEVIFADVQSFDTLTNWESARSVLQEKSWESVILVSSALHLPRVLFFVNQDITAGGVSPESIFAEVQRRPLVFWANLHKEWLAWILGVVLPRDLYRDLIWRWRVLWN